MHLRRFQRSFTTQSKRITNQVAIKLIQNLPKNKGNHDQIIKEAFQIYHEINERKTHSIINTLLQLCVRLKNMNKVFSIWNDIMDIKTGINYQLLFKCCVNNSEQIHIDKSMIVLQLMKDCDYKIKKNDIDHSKNIIKLITRHKNDIQTIKKIHCLIDMNQFTQNIFLKNALINAYGECKHINQAKNVFDTIDNQQMDCITIGAMMKVFIKNNCNDDVIALHQEYNSINNDVTHMLALQACINKNDHQTGLQIIENNINQMDKAKIGHQLQNTVINFYGSFGDIESTEKIFKQIGGDCKNKIININVMLKSYVNNGYDDKALILYNKYPDIINHVSHTLALKACMNLENYDKGKEISKMIFDRKEFRSIELNSTLISFYGQIGDIISAESLFDSIKPKDHTQVSIGCMMKVFQVNGYNKDAMKVYNKFRKLRNDISNLYAIKACIELGNFEIGNKIHQDIMNRGGTQNIKLINSLIDFYGFFGHIDQALMLFDSVCDNKKDHASIGSIMNAFIINGDSKSVISLYDKYKSFMDDTSFALVIKACINDGEFDKGKEIYTDIKKKNQVMSISLSNTLIDFFGTFGELDTALEIFNCIESNKLDHVSIGTMMKTLISHNKSNDALSLYRKYESLHDDISHTLAIKACRNIDDYQFGRDIHQNIGEKIKERNIQYYNAILDFYCHFGEIDIAESIFSNIPHHKRNAQSINTMMKAFISNKNDDQALIIYDKYESLANELSHLYAIKVCSNTGNIEKGKKIHNRISKDTESDNIILKNAFTEFYGTADDINTAWTIFDSIDDSKKDASTINTMLKCLISTQDALDLYEKYCHLTDDISHVLALKTCKLMGNQQYGNTIYQRIKDKAPGVQLQNSCIDFFGHFGDIDQAKNIFENIIDKDSSSINAMLSAYVDNNQYQDAITLYDEYKDLQDDISHLLVIKASSASGNFEIGEKVHQRIKGGSDHNIALKNTLIDFYGNCGDIDNALSVFNSIPDKEKDIYSIGAMMNAYCNCRMDRKCIQLFENIHLINNKIKPNVTCYSTLFKACTHGTSYHFGKKIHDKLKEDVDDKWILNEKEIQVTLINFYGKCGILNECDDIFQHIKIEQYDRYCTEIGIWNSMIHAHGRNGDIIGAKNIFEIMKQNTNLSGDFRTFIVLINACSHSGDVDAARNIWNTQIIDESIKYHRDVVTSIIDCHSRKGFVAQGFAILKEYFANNSNKYNKQDVTMFMALMSGCQTSQDYQLAQTIYNEMDKYFGDNEKYMASASTILSNIYGKNKRDT